MSAVRRLRAVPIVPAPEPVRKPGTWPKLTAPIFPDTTHARMVARSFLTGMEFQDGSSKPPELTDSQARDIATWLFPRPPTGSPPLSPRWWAGFFWSRA